MKSLETDVLAEDRAEMMAEYEEEETRLKQEEQQQRDWWLESARSSLKSAREEKIGLDVSGDVEHIRRCAKSEGFSLADIGTSEEELVRLGS